jgi:hypothetical protein
VGVAPKLFAHPHGIARDDDDAVVYVADTGHDRIVAIRIKPAADVLPPRAAISSPAPSATVHGLAGVRGVAADAHFARYVLEYGRGADPETFIPVTTSTDPVWNGSLGIWDVSALASGPYVLRLTVTDQAGNASVASVPVIVQGVTAPLIVSASISPAVFVPDRTGLQIAYQLAQPAAVTAAVLPANSNHPVWMAEAPPNGYGGLAGPNTMAWDGRDESGRPVVPGAYIALLMARAGDTVERRTISLLALLSPEAQVAALAGPGGGGGGAAAGAGSAAAGSGSGTSSAATGGTAAAGTGTITPAGTPHDNGWHEGNNPNGFTIDHPDKSQGNGNNHH